MPNQASMRATLNTMRSSIGPAVRKISADKIAASEKTAK
jgi:hypothetical protein